LKTGKMFQNYAHISQDKQQLREAGYKLSCLTSSRGLRPLFTNEDFTKLELEAKEI